MKFKLILLVLIGIVSSCSQNDETTYNMSKLRFSKIFKYEHGRVNRLYLVDSSTIILRNPDGIRDHFMHQYSLINHELVEKHFKGGRHKNEIMGSVANGLTANYLWMFDISLRKVVIRDLSKFLSDSSSLVEYEIPEYYYSFQLHPNGKEAYVAGAHETYRLSIIQKINLFPYEIVDSAGLIMGRPKEMPLSSWKYAHEGFLFQRPDGDHLALANRFTDKVEFFNMKDQVNAVFHGPDSIDVRFEVVRFPDGRYGISRNEQTKFAYLDAVATNNKLYLLYSGNLHDSKYLDFGKHIHVLNWHGELEKIYKLPKYVSSITVTSDDKTLYAFEPDSKYIVRADLID